MTNHRRPEAPSVESIAPRHLLEQNLLLEVSQAVSSTLDLEAVLQIISDGTARLVAVETAAVYLVEGDRLFIGATTPPLEPDVPEALRWAERQAHPHIDRAIASRQPLVLPDAMNADLSDAERQVVELRRLRSVLYLPFCLDGEPLGVLILGTTSLTHDFDTHEIDLCRTLTNQLAVGVQNARLHTGLKQYATELERQMEGQQRLSERLRQAQKMEAVGQLAGGVAHDFNNLLQVIQGYSAIALEDVALESDAHDCLEHVLQAAERATLLVRQLLAFGRRQALNMALVDLNQIISDLLPMLRPLLGEHILVEVDLAPNLGTLHADANQLEQIVINLCVNARDAMPSGGSLTIRTQNVAVDENHSKELGLPSSGPHVLLEVIDAGCGMDPETRARVFEPFFTTKQPGRGTGLGLATVHGLVGQHQGAIHLSSAIDHGTTASVYLPLAPESVVATEPISRSRAVGGAETLLVAEDDPNVRKLTQALLEAAGYTVLAAADGEEATRIISERADDIDLVILDIVMPKRGGELVFHDLRARRPDVPVLFASAYEPSFRSGSRPPPRRVDSIQKPFTREDLLRKVRSALDESD